MRPSMDPILYGLVNCTIFGAPENHRVYVSGPLPACGRIRPSILDTPDFTDQENINSTFREEPPKWLLFMDIVIPRAK